MENLEKESLSRLETLNCEMEDIKEMVNLMNEDCFVFNDSKWDDFEIRDKFRTAQTMTNAILKLLCYSIKDSNEFIDRVYTERKTEKEGVN